MIWIFSLLVLISIGGSFSDDCRMKAREQCDQSLAPRSFPQSAEEFMTTCRNVQTLGNCVVDALSDCDEANRNELKEIRKMIDYLSTMCLEDNPTFKAISNNFQCIEPILPRAGMSCGQIIGKGFYDIFEEHMLPLFESGRESNFTMCLDLLIEVKCPAVLLGYKCGDGVKDATEDIYMEFGPRRRFSLCSPEIIEELEPNMEAFESLLLEQLKLEDEDGKRK
nr:venom protein [Lampona murina]